MENESPRLQALREDLLKLTKVSFTAGVAPETFVNQVMRHVKHRLAPDPKPLTRKRSTRPLGGEIFPPEVRQ